MLNIISIESDTINKNIIDELKDVPMDDKKIDYSLEGMRETALETVTNMSDERITDIVKHLNKKGVITEYDEPGFTSTVMEHFTSDCSKHLKLNGYDGEDLELYIKNYDCEANYLLYDPSIYDENDNILALLSEYMDVTRAKHIKPF